MLTRTLLLAAFCLVPIVDFAHADDPGKAPCQILTDYLRDFAKARPDQAADTGLAEFFKAAIHLWDEAADPEAPISAVPTQSADTVEDALHKIPGATVAEADRAYFDDIGLQAEGWRTEVRDLRPYSPYVLVSQDQGTMHCNVTATLRIQGERLVPVPTAQTSEGDVCWTAGLTALRIGQSAYPAISAEDNGPGSLSYEISLLEPEGPIGTESGFCKLSVTYAPKSFIADWNVAPGVDPAFLARLRAVLDPVMTAPGQDDAALNAMAPAPSDNSAYDIFVRAAEDKKYDVLNTLDTDGNLHEIPFTDESYTDASQMPAYPIGFEQRRFILLYGQPTFGWRVFPDNAFALWEWKDKKLVPLASGYVEKRADKPVIAVE